MDTKLHEGKVFENIYYSEKELSKREFDQCTFVKCDFSKSNLSHNEFIDCTFKNCNFSLTKLNNTGLKNCTFLNSKVLGVDFSPTKDFLFSVLFKNCILDYSSFIQKKMKKTIFTDCSLKEVNFEGSDLSLSVFANCNLESAIFMHTTIEKADFSTASNYTLDPEQNKIKGAKFSQYGALGLLAKYGIEIEG
jgi:fluoroquinolone resistance protein